MNVLTLGAEPVPDYKPYTGYDLAPLMVHPNPRQDVWFPTPAGGQFSDLGAEAGWKDALTSTEVVGAKAISEYESRRTVSSETWKDLRMRALDLRDAIPMGKGYDSMKRAASTMLNRISSRDLPGVVTEADYIATIAKGRFGYKRAEELKALLAKFYLTMAEKFGEAIKTLKGKLKDVDSIADWNAWWQEFQDSADRYLLVIPLSWPGYSQLFSVYKQVAKSADAAQRSLSAPGWFISLMSKLYTVVQGTIEGATKWLKENFPDVLGALKWLPYVAVGVLAFAGYSYIRRR